MGTVKTAEVKQSLKRGQNPSLRGVCEGRKNRGLVSIGEALDSVRGLTRVQYSSRVNGTRIRGWLKILMDGQRAQQGELR